MDIKIANFILFTICLSLCLVCIVKAITTNNVLWFAPGVVVFGILISLSNLLDDIEEARR